MKRTSVTAVLATTLLLLAGCGGDGDGSSNDETNSNGDDSVDLAEDFPACADVWVEGKSLPEDYEGCQDGDTVVDIAFTPCQDGTTQLRIHQTGAGENTHFAITGEAIQAYSDEAKSEAYLRCQPQD